MIKINISNNTPDDSSLVLLATAESNFKNCGLSVDEIKYIKKQIDAKLDYITLNRCGKWIFVQLVNTANDAAKEREKMRRDACKLQQRVTKQKIQSVAIVDMVCNVDLVCAFAEGIVLSNYQFLKYTTKRDEKQYSLSELTIVGSFDAGIEENVLYSLSRQVDCLNVVIEAVYKARDLVNEPATVITPTRLAEEFEAMGKDAGFDVQVFDKTAIENMKMGGILAVNRGSKEAPTLSVLEWKPEIAKNKRKIVLVGKGLTYDTGGHSLKTGNYMNDMKSDMAGGAAVAAIINAVAKAQLPINVVGIVPSTDNRISADAISPGDIITMYDGTTVEVANTDAEGRLILADALVYAKKYDPELVISIATLTGAAQRAVGDKGMAAMGNASQETIQKLKNCGEEVHERLVEFPLWDEYDEEIKSEIADLKNIGSDYAGMITAGKFLEHFTSYPFIHLDIAGIAFAKESTTYRGKGGTGAGVRLIFDFLKKY